MTKNELHEEILEVIRSYLRDTDNPEDTSFLDLVDDIWCSIMDFFNKNNID